MITRRRLLQAGGLGATGVFYPVVMEPRWLETTHTTVTLPGSLQTSIRVLQLTDFHSSWAVPLSMIAESIRTGLAEHPDLICLTGDFVSYRDGYDARAYTNTLRVLSAYAPTFAVLGNHDGGYWSRKRRGHANHAAVLRILEDAGITLLHNRSQQVQVRGQDLTLVGLGDFWSAELDADTAFRSMPGGKTTLLLSHNPDSKEVLRKYPWHLMLCGHTHGGQVIIPFDGPRYAPVKDKRYVAGLKEWDGRQIYVSRGVGNLFGVRLRCRPEVTILDLKT